MALSRKTFHCKLPQGLLEISERVFVFNCCLTSNISDINEYRPYVGHTVDQLREYFPDSLLMAHNFGDENHQAQISSTLSEYGIAVINHHCQNKTFPLLTQDTIDHFLSLSYNWISSAQSNLLLIHCENGCLPVLAFIIAAFLICSKKYTDARKILGAIYKLEYVWRRETGLEWWAPTCRELRLYGEWPCGPIFRINEPDSCMASDRTCNESKTGRFFRQADGELVKVRFSEMDSTFLLAGLDSAVKDRDDLPTEACVKIQETCTNIHSRASEADDVSRTTQENLENMSRLSGTAGKFDDVFLQNEAKPCVNTPQTVQKLEISSASSDLVNKDGQLLKVLTKTQRGPFKSCDNSDSTSKKKELSEQHVFVHRPAQSKIVLPQVSQTSPRLSPSPLSRYRGTASSALGITALLHDHAEFSNKQVHSPSTLAFISHKDTMDPTDSFMPKSTEEKPPLDKCHIISRSELKSPPPPPPPLPSFLAKSIESCPLSSVPSPPPLLPLPFSDVSVIRNQPAANRPHPLTSSSESSSSFMPPAKNSTAPPAAPSPPAPPLHAALPPAKNSTAPPAAPSPPAPPLHAALPPAKNSIAPPAVPPPPPPALHAAFSPAMSRQTAVAPPPAPFSKGGSTYLQSVKGKLQPRTSVKAQTQAQPRKAPLRPYHWLKLTRAMQGSLWAEVQKPEEASKVFELDISELESLFSTTITNSDHGSNVGKANRHGSGLKPDKTHLIELRRAYNCEIMLTKVKVPLPDLMNSVLALDDSALDVDQVDNLIKFCPTKEEIELLKNYSGERESLGKCEQFFLEMMRVPRVESKLRVFSFKIQFFSQLSDLRNSLNIVNSASQEVRNSVKLKRIMQSILSLGNALNQGTARGSAVGFRLDSLLKLSETRSKNNKLTLIHYLCKVLADKMPEVLDFYEDHASVEAATKIQLKHLAEEMQALSKGLEKVAQEINASEKDGAVSEHFCKTLKEFYGRAEAEVRGLASIYSVVGKNADALALYFGEDPARCPFEQVVSTILSFLRMFRRAHDENCKQKELEKKKAQKQVENEKSKLNVSRN